MIPREVREQIEAMQSSEPIGDLWDEAWEACLRDVIAILDEYDAAYRAERAADVEASAGGQQY